VAQDPLEIILISSFRMVMLVSILFFYRFVFINIFTYKMLIECTKDLQFDTLLTS